MMYGRFGLLGRLRPARGFRYRTVEVGDGSAGGGGGAGSGAAAVGGQGQQSSQQQSQEPEFNEAQQKKIDQILDQHTARVKASTEKVFKQQIDELNAKLADATKKLESLANPEKPAGNAQPAAGDGKTITKADLDQILAAKEDEFGARLKAIEEERETARKDVEGLLTERKNSAIVSAATRHKAIDPEEISLLAGKHVTFDNDRNLIVLNDQGTGPRRGKSGDPLSVDEFIKEFIDKRPHLKQGTGQVGAGSGTRLPGQGGGAPTATPRTFEQAGAALRQIVSQGR